MFISLKILFSFMLLIYTSDDWAFNRYERDKAKAILEKEFCKDHFWMQPDDNLGNPFFITKGDFKKSGKLKVVPVLKLSKSFQDYEYSKDVRDYFEVDYSQFCGLIFKGDKFLDIMFVTYAYDRKGKLAPVASLADTPNKFYETYRQKADRFFFDSVIHSFCFFDGDGLYAWSDVKEQFISYREMIESEKFGLDTFKETVKGK